jgi:hypothetical protein
MRAARPSCIARWYSGCRARAETRYVAVITLDLPTNQTKTLTNELCDVLSPVATPVVRWPNEWAGAVASANGQPPSPRRHRPRLYSEMSQCNEPARVVGR